MIEPIVRAQAGRPPPHIGVRALDVIRAFITNPYSPSLTDSRKFFFDVSQFNDIVMALAAGYQPVQVWGGMIRMCGSATVRDKRFTEYWTTAKIAKLLRMIYTYNYPGYSVDLHIANFMAALEIMARGDLGEGPIWVDAEVHAGKTRREVSNHTIGYIEALERETDKVVGWYTGPWFVNAFMEIQDWMQEKPAWIATWSGGGQLREHPGPAATTPGIPNSQIAFQQTGSNGNSKDFGGVGRYDSDRFAGSDELFKQLFPGGVVPPPNGDLKEQVDKNTAMNIEQDKRLDALEDWAKGIAFNE